MRTFHVVSHTHWDREWYHPAERFRVRLVELIDQLLDEPSDQAFLLDGQAVVLEDYLSVRPERAGELREALRAGRLEAGPWYVLSDELIPGGEGLLRNLLAGRRALRALGADSPPVLYCPDSFGHPAALPEFASGFGKPMILVWRGFGSARWPGGNAFAWTSPSGARVLLYPLTRSGYELGSSLPADVAGARERWPRITSQFDGRSTVPVELLLNGADHHARQLDRDAAIRALQEVARGDTLVASSLSGFARRFTESGAATGTAEVSGELRDSYGFTWTLQGTFASRTPQKRRYAQQERTLVRDVEPWLALAALRTGEPTGHLVRAAWHSVLLCQPHDTLCGCSIDQVARAMDARLDAAAAQSQELQERGIERLLGHDRDVARHRQGEWTPTLIVRNRAARTRSGVALVEVVLKIADVPVGPGSAPPKRPRARNNSSFVDVDVTHDRTEAPRAYPDNDAVARFHTAVWVDDVPAHGLATIQLRDDAALSRPAPTPVVVKRRSMSNGRLALRWDARGRITLEDLALRRTLDNLFSWESRTDLGDLYTPSIRGPRLKARILRTTVLAHGPLSAVLEQQWRLASGRDEVTLQMRIVLDAGAAFLRFGILGDNAARDHRLRLVVHTDVRKPRVFADAAFGTVERARPRITRSDARMEAVPGTDPLHRYVALFGERRGATLFSDGLTEYESIGGKVALTLLRAVGELSRNDLPERPGHAGWPAPTPQAQCIGPFEAEFGLLLHGPRDADVIDEIERAADDVLLPLTGTTLRSALSLPTHIQGVELVGRGLALSSIKQAEEGMGIVLRCVNLTDSAVSGSWRLGHPVREAQLVRLDETVLSDLTVRGSEIAFTASPRAVVSVLVR